jgi:ABC-2 type transport system permease protein
MEQTMNKKVILTQVKREFWENKTGFIYAPLIVTGLVIALLFALAIYAEEFSGLGQFSSYHDSITHQEDHRNGNFYYSVNKNSAFDISINDGTDTHKTEYFDWHQFKLDELEKDHNGILACFIYGATLLNTGLLMIVFFVILLIYAHSCLFDDRKNREILFWRSMPVSETTNVLVKLALLILLAPVAMLILNFAVGVFALVESVLFFLFHGSSVSTIYNSLTTHFGAAAAAKLFLNSLLIALLMAPIYSFVLFCSAFAKKSPFFTSSLIPIALIIADGILNRLTGINLHVNQLLGSYWHSLARVMSSINPEGNSELGSELLGVYIIALLVGGLFTYAAIWLRNNRYEL